jgi:hypothetical protein
MTAVAAVCSLSTAAVALILFLRLRSANLDGRRRLSGAKAPDDFPGRTYQLICVSVDAGLLANAGPGGLAQVEVCGREARDPYRSVAELIDWLTRQAGAMTYQEICELIKGVYQLGQSLRAPEADIQLCLEPLIARIKQANVGGSAVARVECVRPGTILDPGTMAPLNYGARVIQPLGVLVYDSAGKVLGKAKVLCG